MEVVEPSSTFQRSAFRTEAPPGPRHPNCIHLDIRPCSTTFPTYRESVWTVTRHAIVVACMPLIAAVMTIRSVVVLTSPPETSLRFPGRAGSRRTAAHPPTAGDGLVHPAMKMSTRGLGDGGAWRDRCTERPFSASGLPRVGGLC